MKLFHYFVFNASQLIIINNNLFQSNLIIINNNLFQSNKTIGLSFFSVYLIRKQTRKLPEYNKYK